MNSSPRFVLWTACLIAFVGTVGIALPYPVLAPLLAGDQPPPFALALDYPPKLLLGFALAVNPLGILLGSTLLGAWSDRHGRRRVLTISLALAALGHAGSAVALAQGSFAWFVLARFLTGLCEGNVAIARAIVADLHPAVERNYAFGWLNSAVFMGWLAGPLIGGLTLPLGNAVPFWIGAACMLPALLLVRFVLGADAVGRQAAETAPPPTRHLLRVPGLAAVLALQLAYTLGINAFYEFYPLWLVEGGGYDSRAIGFATALMCLLMTLTSALAWPRWSRRIEGLSGAALALGAFVLLLAALPLLPGHPGALLIVLSGIPIAVYNAALPVHVSMRFGHLGQGRMMGLLTTVFCLGNVLIALAGGVLSLFDTRWVLWLGAACLLLALQLLLALRGRERRRLAAEGAADAALPA